MSRVLIVEDEAEIARALAGNLNAEGFETHIAPSGKAGLERATSWRPDLVVLDLRLPDLPGEDVLAELRRRGDWTPVLILSAKSDEMTKVRGFRAGADDYVTKPFALLELLARIDRLVRPHRPAPVAAQPAVPVRIGAVEVQPDARRVTRDGHDLDLRPKEMDLLLAFVAEPNRVLSRRELLDRVWGYDRTVESRTVDWHVAVLRQKLETDPARPAWIVTVRKAGYRLDLPAKA